jgi:hypothetical protein
MIRGRQLLESMSIVTPKGLYKIIMYIMLIMVDKLQILSMLLLGCRRGLSLIWMMSDEWWVMSDDSSLITHHWWAGLFQCGISVSIWHLCHIEFLVWRLNKIVRHSSVPQLHALSRHPHHFTSPIHPWSSCEHWWISLRCVTLLLHTTSNATYEA